MPEKDKTIEQETPEVTPEVIPEEKQEVKTEPEPSVIDEELAKLKQLERDMSLTKVKELEDQITELKNTNAQVLEMLKELKGNKQADKIETPQKESYEQIRERKVLLEQMAKLEKQVKDGADEKFISERIAEKPYIKDTIKKLGIKTQQQYISMIMPLEESLKEAEENKEKINKMTMNDPFNRQVKTLKDPSAIKYTAEQKEAIEKTESFIGSIFK